MLTPRFDPSEWITFLPVRPVLFPDHPGILPFCVFVSGNPAVWYPEGVRKYLPKEFQRKGAGWQGREQKVRRGRFGRFVRFSIVFTRLLFQ